MVVWAQVTSPAPVDRAVSKDTAIVTYAASTKDELKPGAVVFINNPAKKDDGTFEAAAVTVSRGGVNPPM